MRSTSQLRGKRTVLGLFDFLLLLLVLFCVHVTVETHACTLTPRPMYEPPRPMHAPSPRDPCMNPRDPCMHPHPETHACTLTPRPMHAPSPRDPGMHPNPETHACTLTPRPRHAHSQIAHNLWFHVTSLFLLYINQLFSEPTHLQKISLDP